MKKFLGCLFGLVLVASLWALTPQELARRQARSVHLWYRPAVPNAEAVRGTVTVDVTQTNSYYMIAGWDCGYCGLQDKGAGGRILIFSVWDPSNPHDYAANPNLVREEIRAKVLYAAPEVNVARFGGEGTGARTITPIGWNVGESVTVEIVAARDGTNRTAYTCSYRKGSGEWRTLATISTLVDATRAHGINGVHSFVEDFWRNGHSATLARRATFSDIATRTAGKRDWVCATDAVFTADGTDSKAIDAGRVGPCAFFLATGGATTNATTKLWGLVR